MVPALSTESRPTGPREAGSASPAIAAGLGRSTSGLGGGGVSRVPMPVSGPPGALTGALGSAVGIDGGIGCDLAGVVFEGVADPGTGDSAGAGAGARADGRASVLVFLTLTPGAAASSPADLSTGLDSAPVALSFPFPADFETDGDGSPGARRVGLLAGST